VAAREPEDDQNGGFEPLRWLSSRDGRDAPPRWHRHVAGANYPSAEDLRPYLPGDDAKPGDLRLPFACPIVGVDDERRGVRYGVPVVIPSRERDAHAAVWGPTGCGKTSRVLQPWLL
jgi:hypothetical protein